MADISTPPGDRSGASEPEVHAPAPRPLTRWIWIWLAAGPGFYVASFLAAVALDRLGFVPSALHGTLRAIYWPIIFLGDSYRPIRAALDWFFSLFPR